MSKKNKILNVHPDAPDLRDRIYSPTLRLLERAYNPKPYADASWQARIKDQGQTSACTGFALAAMVEALTYRAWCADERQDDAPEEISHFMLYYFARKPLKS